MGDDLLEHVPVQGDAGSTPWTTRRPGCSLRSRVLSMRLRRTLKANLKRTRKPRKLRWAFADAGGRRGVQKRRKARLERRWRKRGDNRLNKLHKKKNVAKLEARKRRRLAKKLRKMME